MKTVKVYDTFTRNFKEIEVTQDVYEAYMRSEWNIHDNGESFYKHEIQFSQLAGGEDGAFENFHEFIIDGDPTAGSVHQKMMLEKLSKVLNELDEPERRLIRILYFQNKSERECAAYLGISQKNINKKKQRILVKLNKLISNTSD